MHELPDEKPRLEDVFKVSGIPTYTFVEPRNYSHLLLNLRTAGRCLVIEGPSGIGKTTAVEKALSSVGLGDQITKLSARRQADLEYIQCLPEISEAGTVLVDDYHKLPAETKGPFKNNFDFWIDILSIKQVIALSSLLRIL